MKRYWILGRGRRNSINHIPHEIRKLAVKIFTNGFLRDAEGNEHQIWIATDNLEFNKKAMRINKTEISMQ